MLNARRSFGPFTWVPVLNNVVALIGLVAFGMLFGFDPDGSRTVDDWTPAWSPSSRVRRPSASPSRRVVLFWFWRRIGLRYRPDFAWRGVGLGAAGRMAGWTFGMLLLTTFAGIVQTQVVLHGLGHGRLGRRDRQRVARVHAARTR